MVHLGFRSAFCGLGVILSALNYSCTGRTSQSFQLFHQSGEEKNNIPVENFFRNPEKTSFSISPDGNFFSYLAPYKNRLNIFVRPISGGNSTRITSDTLRDIRTYRWINNRQVVYLQDASGNEEFKLYTTDFEGKNNRCLTDFKGVTTRLLDPLDKSYDEVLITMNKRDRRMFDAYNLNINTGEFRIVAENPGTISSWYSDHDGNVRLAVSADGVNTNLLFREKLSDPFKIVLSASYRDKVEPLFFDFNNRYIYLLSNQGRDKAAIVQFDPVTQKELLVIADDPDYDLSGLQYSARRHVLTEVHFTSWKKERKILDSVTAQLYNRIEELLDKNDQYFYLACKSEAEDKFIVRTYSDRTMGSYYCFDANKKTLKKIADVAPWLDQDELAEMKPVEFKSRDGLTIHGYLTIPRGADPKNLPVVVNPHGGPWYRNCWGFNPEVQFLTNRGYAVLQVNFRGSTGYGKKFWESSFKEWGGKMQDDITDGVKWLIKEGIADSNRIAIYGSSFGGYSALCGLTNQPDLYACGVDYVGISNLFTFIKTIPPYHQHYLKSMYEMIGDPKKDSALFVRYSPIFHLDKIKDPVMIVQGSQDPRVDKQESDMLVQKLREQGNTVEYMVRENEGHGYMNEENRLEFYRTLEKFLQQHLQVSAVN